MTTRELYTIYLDHRQISTDTRSLVQGDFFFALRGPRFNGNEKVDEALEKEASFAVVDDPKFVRDSRTILVEDTLKALQDLSSWHRNTMKFPVFAITGSNGKTTTKELLMAVLSSKFSVWGTPGNFNNHIGLPLTILSTPDDCECLILEMGSNQPGDIRLLCDIARPDFGLITNIGLSHLEKLGSKEGVLEEKAALYHSVLSNKGVFFLNVGDQLLRTLPVIDNIVFTYNAQGFNSYGIKVIDGNKNGLYFSIEKGDEAIKVKTHLFGALNMQNLAAALCAGTYFEVKLSKAIDSIENYRPSNMRSQIINSGSNTIILDSYNANPSSMKLAVADFIHTKPNKGVLIIGDMLELGPESEVHHRELVHWLDSKSELRKIYVGKILFNLSDSSEKFESVENLMNYLSLHPINGAQIFIKGSRGIKLEKVLGQL